MIPELLSFCCVSYNHEKYIESCIKSIWNNDYKNIEIFVLDDGSEDNSVNVLNGLKSISPCPMTVISQKNTGCIGANYNKLLKMANGEFISIISCDDALIENTVNQKVQMMLDDKNIAYICNSRITGIDENGNETNGVPKMKLDSYKNPSSQDILELDFNDFHSYFTQGSVYRRDVILDFGGFDEDMICDDIIFRTKLSRYMLEHPELQFKVLHSPAVYYRLHSSNVSRNSLRQLSGIIEYLDRYWNDMAPPDILYKWLDFYAASADSKEDFLNLFENNNYASKIFEKKNYSDWFLNNKEFKSMGILYKRFGIPYILCWEKYKKQNYRTLVIRLFNIKIFKYTFQL